MPLHVAVYRVALALLLLAAPAFGPALAADGRPALTLDSIFSSEDFENETVDNIEWKRDGSAFTFAVANPETALPDVYEHDVRSGAEGRVLSAASVAHEGLPPPAHYEWAPNRRYLLVQGPATLTWDSVLEAPWSVYDTEAGELRAIADGRRLRNVKVSPDGTRVGYVLDNDIYISELDTGESRAVTTDGSPDIFNGIFDYGSRMFGFIDAWRWSPDGRKIAFWRLDVTDVKVFYMIDELGKYNTVRPLKYPNTGEKHAVSQIGVFDLESGQRTWMDVGDNPDDYIVLIHWTPSAEKLAIQRLTRDHQRLDLLMADPNTGESRVIVTDRDPAWIDITTDLTFLERSQRFVWTSEKSGWRHAYIYDHEGNETQLTDGDWEISSLIAVDEAQGSLYFYAKKDSFIDQHVYRVPLAGGDVEKVSRQPGWYEWSFSPDRKYVIETYSNTRTPPQTSLRRPSGELVRVLAENDLPGLKKYHVPELEFIKMETTDGVVLNASLIKPPGFDEGKTYPVIGYGYGNAGSQVVVNRWAGRSGIQRELWHKYMAGQGYVIFMMDNRTTAGRGKAAKNLTYGHYAKWAVHDQIEGVRYLKSLPWVDASRIGFWGWSGGGYLTAALMTKGAPHWKVGVSIAPVIDLERYQAVGVERWMGFIDENPEGYRKVDLMNDAHRLEGDLLLIHGTGDENVKFAFTLQFADSLIRAGKQFDMMVYPNEHHGLEGVRRHVYTKMTDYFREKL